MISSRWIDKKALLRSRFEQDLDLEWDIAGGAKRIICLTFYLGNKECEKFVNFQV
jgi:hypothetical protein